MRMKGIEYVTVEINGVVVETPLPREGESDYCRNLNQRNINSVQRYAIAIAKQLGPDWRVQHSNNRSFYLIHGEGFRNDELHLHAGQRRTGSNSNMFDWRIVVADIWRPDEASLHGDPVGISIDRKPEQVVSDLQRRLFPTVGNTIKERNKERDKRLAQRSAQLEAVKMMAEVVDSDHARRQVKEFAEFRDVGNYARMSAGYGGETRVDVTIDPTGKIDLKIFNMDIETAMAVMEELGFNCTFSLP